MLEGLARLDLLVLSASLPGMLLTIVLLARAVAWLFRHFHSAAFHGILGIVTASTVIIVPTAYAGMGEAALSALAFVSGFLLAERFGHL